MSSPLPRMASGAAARPGHRPARTPGVGQDATARGGRRRARVATPGHPSDPRPDLPLGPGRVRGRDVSGDVAALTAMCQEGRGSLHDLSRVRESGRFRISQVVKGDGCHPPLRRAGPGPRLSRPLHPPGGPRQPPLAGPGGRESDLPGEGLPGRELAHDPDAGGGGVHPALPPPRLARSVHAPAPLRVPEPPPPGRPARPVPRTPRRPAGPAATPARLADPVRGPDRRTRRPLG
jgi:hypothetical protein